MLFVGIHNIGTLAVSSELILIKILAFASIALGIYIGICDKSNRVKVEQLENKNYCEIDMSSCVEVDGVDPCGDSITTLGAILNDIYSKLPN